MGVLKEAVERLVQGVTEPPASLNSELCVHTRFIRSECNICVDLCPQDAILKDKGKISVSQDCDGCGVCVSGCPNGAFAFSQEGSTLQKIKASKSENTIAFVCRKYNTGPYSPEILKLNCMGSITFPDILYSAVKANSVIIAIDKCSNCESINGMKNFRKTLDASKKLLLMINKDNINVISSSNLSEHVNFGQKKRRNFDIERRKLFTVIANKALPVSRNNQSIKESNHETRQSLNLTRKALIEFLNEHSESIIGDMPEAIPAGEISIDKHSCFGCNVCEHVCPGGAISRSETPDEVSIMFNPTWCSACNACVDACLTGAINLKRGINLKNFIKNKDSVLVKLHRSICKNCGIDFFTDSNTLCPLCRKGN